ncbi:aromatic-L-amino-acid decarboxylase [Oratosquilla oratoria]|uniref:aromatic-L-amino-acid decarboxylase n=1 Tax=Oratosquilla oratoria TaxID=337810 RepID=UPI003F761512
MDADKFQKAAGEMAKYITDYLENIRDKRVLPEVEPGYLRPLIPDSAPEDPESWQDIMKDIDRVIMPGVTHWHSPQFHAYFPTGNSYPCILADMLSDAIGCIGFSWIASPACTELEMVMMDWLGQLLGLPKEFLFSSGGKGGGVIQGTASEATLVALLSARARAVQRAQQKDPDLKAGDVIAKMVAYASDTAHSSVERAGLLAGVPVRLLPPDDMFALRGAALLKAIEEDLEKGNIPICVVGTLGATSACSFDNLAEIGREAQKHNLWFHVDAAYAGSALVCEEYRYLMKGIEFADSFNFNPHKWLLVQFDCSAMWVRNADQVVNAFCVEPLYLRHDQQGKMPDYRHWQIPLGRRFRSLKLWFVMRTYGRKKLQEHIRKQIGLAHEFEEYVKADPRFELFFPVTLGLVCFRIKGSNEVNEQLLKKINAGGVIHMVPSKMRDTYFLRFAVCSRFMESHDVTLAWEDVKAKAKLVLEQVKEDGALEAAMDNVTISKN